MEDSPSPQDTLSQIWMLYTAKNEQKYFEDYAYHFLDIYKNVLESEFQDSSNAVFYEGPHLTILPNEILKALGKYFSQYTEQYTTSLGDDTSTLEKAESLLKCLIIISRNYDNIPLVANSNFVSSIVIIASVVVEQICDSSEQNKNVILLSFLKHTIYFFECLYDPYFVWRKRLRKCTVDKSHLNIQPALLHVEVIPYFHECFQKKYLPEETQIHLLHMFGGVMSGDQHNALRSITPATLDVLLKALSSQKPQNELDAPARWAIPLKEVVLKCIVRMVHVIHCSCPDQRQVEVGQMLEGYLSVLLSYGSEVTNNDSGGLLLMINILETINEMLLCRDRKALQVILVACGTIDAFIKLLHETLLTGAKAQKLAVEILDVINMILLGSPSAKVKFQSNNGYTKLLESLKCLGQPSMDLLKLILNLVVEDVFDDHKLQNIRNVPAAKLLLHWLPDIQSADLQVWLSKKLQLLCCHGYINLMNCCNEGLIGSILTALKREKQITYRAVYNLIHLLETMATLSISSLELKQLIGLLRIDEEDKMIPYCSRLLKAMSTMARRDGRDESLHFFCIQEPGAGISIPCIKKWPGAGFSFHSWICLDNEVNVSEFNLYDTKTYRRQLYSFSTSSGNGFEAFFTSDGVLVVAVYNRKDHSSVSLTDYPFKDSHWHCLDIVHTNSRRPFANSQLAIYVDGCLKLNVQLKFPTTTEAFSSCKIGSAGLRSPVEFLVDMSPVSPTVPERRRSSSLKFFNFSSSTRSDYQSEVTNLLGGTQDDTWGQPIALMGLLGSVCVFHEPLQPGEIKSLYSHGPNYSNIFTEDGDFSDLPGKLLLYYNAKACKDGFCIDLSFNQNHGQLHGYKCITWDIKDVINCIGGIQILFPLLEHINKCHHLSAEVLEAGMDNNFNRNPIERSVSDPNEEWVLVQHSSSTDAKLEQNQVAAFLTLLRNMLQTKTKNQDSFIRTHGAATVGALLQKVNSELIDVHVLMAVQLLVEAAATTNTMLLRHLYQFILFDFRVWSRSDFPVRIGHIQYLATIIKDDRKHFRKKYGVQYILDVIRTYYSSVTEGSLTKEDTKTIRVSLLGLIKFYIAKDITFDELSQILAFLLNVKEEDLKCEVLDILLMLMENPRKKPDQLILLLFEPDMSELLYILLIDTHYSNKLTERILKLFHILLTTDKVYDKSKNRLRLHEMGYVGMLSMMRERPISLPVAELMLKQLMLSDTSQCYSAILGLMQLIQESDISIKLECSKQILKMLVTVNGAAKNFAKQLCWQEILCKLFIYYPKSTCTMSNSFSHPILKASEDCTLRMPSSVSSYVISKSGEDLGNDVEVSSQKMFLDIRPSVPPQSLLSPCSLVGTPMYDQLKSEYWGLEDTEDRERSMSRSSSTSIEDLSSLRGSGKSAESLSNGLIPHSESFIDIPTVPEEAENEELLRIRKPSVLEAEAFQKALDSLGIPKIYVQESVDDSDEFMENMLMVLALITMKGVEGSDKAAWRERGQVFSCLDKMNQSYELLKHPNELKRRLLEILLISCTYYVRDSGQSMAYHTENAVELIKIVQDFIMDNINGSDFVYSERLVEDVMALLEALSVWDTQSESEWREMVHIGFRILLSFACRPELELCAVATARLHSLVQTRILTSSAEASYLVGTLYNHLQLAINENSDTYSFVIPVLKALIDKSYTLLNMEIYLPHLPPTSRSPTFFDDFRVYCQEKEWSDFVSTQINPQLQQFIEKIFLEHQSAMIEFWSECHEQMMLNKHKRNLEQGKSKLAFQSQIVDVAKSKVSQEHRRFQNVTTQLRNQHNAVMRQWRATKRFFLAKRGAWSDESSECKHWKLSNQENFSRMRVKLVPNYNFDPHTEPSRLRDNQDLPDKSEEDGLQKLELAKEALVSRENIADDALGDEDWNVISSANMTGEEYSGKEKLVLLEDCELVTMVDVIKGRLEVTTTHVYFFDCSPMKEEGGEDFKWNLSQLREIHFRRYNLRRSALELFLIDQTNYFLNFEKKVRNKVYSRILSLRPPNLIYHGTRSPAELLKASGLTQKWVQREISNFDYLMQLNTIAGRTYNDLSQYPVFPWIICDYTSSTLDIDDPSIYRDLSKPIGAVNPKHEEEIREKFDLFEDPSGTVEKFHYGTHYSNAAGVQHYMIRLEPFTTLHIQLQSDRFDVADRQFHSIPSSWQSIYENPNDVKELIPEFFYLPEFLYNMNHFDLGTLQVTKERVHDVILPNWAKTAEEFIYQHKKALESEFVSSQLHNWIDLIFGYKQKGPAAIEALNVFYYCTYEGAVDLDAVKDLTERKALEGMINNFGQTPCQLLKELHPKRLSFEEVSSRANKSEKPLSILNFINQLKTYFVEVSDSNDPVVYISVPRIQTRSIIQHGMPDSMITLTEDRVLGVHGWLCYDKSISHYFTFEKDPSLANNKTKKRLPGAFSPGLKVEPKLFVVSHDARLLFTGGHWDNSLQVFHLSKSKKVNHIIGHIDVVTCLALGYCGSHLITGSRDTTCMIWKVLFQAGNACSLSSKPSQILYGHDDEVTAVHISTELDMAVSASRDGTVIIHTVRKGHYMRTLQPPCDPADCLNIPQIDVADNGQICLFCEHYQTPRTTTKYSLQLYTINGKHLFQHQVSHAIHHMAIGEDYLVTGNDQGYLTIYELFGLAVITTIPLLVPIQCIAFTPGNTHILVALRDGKLIIVGTKSKAEIK
ncbi:1 isoform X1 [Octopus vulgaris]|uniref:1 isoform X1 n=1 Tax=Octopus vulgaris TaxID=6645 RepID=A0AA36B3U7_OCTVU|nr:1 isoform X1 [Octopus vulgaris]